MRKRLKDGEERVGWIEGWGGGVDRWLDVHVYWTL